MKLKLIEINKMCPRMIDNETRFDSIFLLHEKNIQYNYTLININKSDPILDDLIKQVKPILIQRVKVNNEFKLIRVYKASATYLYRDKDGDTLFNFTVTPQQYSN